LVVRQSALDGQVDDRAARILEIMTNEVLDTDPSDQTLNPLDENGDDGYSADVWGYRRTPVAWPDYQHLPSPEAGLARWFVEPREAVRGAGLDTALRACR
jgi:hypothetical protein